MNIVGNNGLLQLDNNELLGTGCFGHVYKGMYDGNIPVAIKRMLKSDSPQETRLITKVTGEIELLKKINDHVNIIRYQFSDTDNLFFYIALDLCDGTLVDLLNPNNQTVTISSDISPAEHIFFKIKILKDIATGLDYLHTRTSGKIIHGDLTPNNVLLKKVEQSQDPYKMKALISDFGLSLEVAEDLSSVAASASYAGTRGWKAKELLTGKKKILRTSADVFAFGCLVQFMLCPAKKRWEKYVHPFGDLISREVYIRKAKRVAYLYGNHLKPNDPKFDYLLGDILVDLCVNSKYFERLTTSEILIHPLFWNCKKKMQFVSAVFNMFNANNRYLSKDPEAEIKNLEDQWNELNFDRHKYIRKLLPELWDTYFTQKPEGPRPDTLFFLMRHIRNIHPHYQEQKDSLQNFLGEGSSQEIIRYVFNRVIPAFPVIYISFYNGEALQGLEDRNEYYCMEAEYCNAKRDIAWKRIKELSFYKLSFNPDDKLFGTENFFKGTFVDMGSTLRTEVAIERIEIKKTKSNIDKIEKKVELLKLFHHKNIVRYIYSEIKDGFFYNIAFDLCESTFLEFFDLENNTVNVPENIDTLKIKLLRDIAEGLNYLHSECEGIIIHGDLTPRSILLKRMTPNQGVHEMRAVIYNFESSVRLEEGKTSVPVSAKHGTRGWKPKELLKTGNKKLTTSADVFAFGCLVQYTLAVDRTDAFNHPFGKVAVRESNILSGKRTAFLYDGANCADILIDSCVASEPSKRLTTAKIIVYLRQQVSVFQIQNQL